MHNAEERQELRRGERQAAVEVIATEIIAEVTVWSAAHPRAKWEELEQEVLQARQRFGERLLQRLVAEREEARPVPGPQCPTCGREMRYKGQKTRHVVSSIGETPITRGYYYCSECQRGIFPPGCGARFTGAARVEPATAAVDEQVSRALAIRGSC